MIDEPLLPNQPDPSTIPICEVVDCDLPGTAIHYGRRMCPSHLTEFLSTLDALLAAKDLQQLVDNVRNIQQATGKGSTEQDPIKLDRKQLEKMMKAGLIRKDPPKPFDVGVVEDVRISPGCNLNINHDTWACHPTFAEQFKDHIVKQGFTIRKMQRPEKKRAIDQIPAAIQRWKDHQVNAKIREEQQLRANAEQITYAEIDPGGSEALKQIAERSRN